MIESILKIARYCPLAIQGFSNFLGLFQGIMANPVSVRGATFASQESLAKQCYDGGMSYAERAAKREARLARGLHFFLTHKNNGSCSNS